MRFILGIFTIVLFLIALAGLGSGIEAIIWATHQRSEAGVIVIILASIPFLIGTVALAGLGVISAVNTAHTEQEETLRRVALASETLVRYHQQDAGARR